MKGAGARRGAALARPATLGLEDDDGGGASYGDDEGGGGGAGRAPSAPPPASRTRGARSTATAARDDDDGDADDDEELLDPDAPADFDLEPALSGRVHSASSHPAALPNSSKNAAVNGSSRRSLLGGGSGGGPLGGLKRAAASKKLAALTAAAALAEQRAALKARMATAFALGGGSSGGEGGGRQHHQQEQNKQPPPSAEQAAATALAAAMAQGLGPGFGPPSEPGAFWRAALHMIVTPAWALVLALSWLCNQWQRLWRPFGGLFWWSVDGLDRRLPGLVEWALWLLGEASLLLHVTATATMLGVAIVTLRHDDHFDQAGDWGGGGGADPTMGIGGRGGGQGSGGASLPPAAAALASSSWVFAPPPPERAAALAVLTLYALSHYCTAAAMFRELDLRDQGGCYFSDLVAFLGRVLDVFLMDVQLVACAVHGNRILEGGAQLSFRGYEEARVAAGALLFTGPGAAALAAAHYRMAGGRTAAEAVEQLKAHLQRLGDLRSLATHEGYVRAALFLAAANTLEKLARLSAVDPWAHDPGDGFPLLYVRSHAARLPGSLVRDWLFRCRCALQDSGGRLALADLFAFYTQQVRERRSSGLSDAHKAHLLRKAVHVFSTRAELAARRRMEAALAAGVGPAGLSAADVAAAPPWRAGRATLAAAPVVVVAVPALAPSPGSPVQGGKRAAAAGPWGGAGGNFSPPPGADDASAAAPSAAAAAAAAPAAHLGGLHGRGRPVAIRALAADALRPGPKLCRMIAEVLADASYVHTVSLASNALEDDAVCAVVVACLGTGADKDGGGDGGGDGGDAEGAAAANRGRGGGLARDGNPDLALAHLDLSGNRVGPLGAACLARALSGHAGASLRTLVLSGNPVRDEGAAALAAALRGGAPGGGAPGGGGGGGHLPGAAAALGTSPSVRRRPCLLERLDLSDTAVGPKGAIALASALRHNASLRWLSVAGSRVGAVGVEAIAKSLARAGAGSGLVELDVGRTGADDRAAAALAAMLSAPGSQLQLLGMAGTAVTDAGAQLICAALEGNASLRSIDVSGSPRMDASWGRLMGHALRPAGGGWRGDAGGGGGGGGGGGWAAAAAAGAGPAAQAACL